MADKRNPRTDPEQLLVYHIRLQGHLNPRWAAWYGNVTVTLQENGQTLLICTVIDQAALHGLLRKVRDLGLPLLEVRQVGSGSTGAAQDEGKP